MFQTIFLVALRIFSNSFLNVFQKKFSKTTPVLYTNFQTYFLLFIVALPVLLFKNLSFEVLLWAFIGGVFGALGNAFLIAALKYGELSFLAPLNSYKALIGLIFSAILIKEVPTLESCFGIVLIILGSYFIFDTTANGFSFSLFKRKDIQYRFLALLFTAIEAVFIKKVILLSSPFCSFLLWVVFGCVFAFVFLKIKKEKPFNKKYGIKAFILLSLLVLIMQMSTNLVFFKMPVASALALFQLSNIINVFLGYKIFREKNLLKKILASIIMTMGAIIIILR